MGFSSACLGCCNNFIELFPQCEKETFQVLWLCASQSLSALFMDPNDNWINPLSVLLFLSEQLDSLFDSRSDLGAVRPSQGRFRDRDFLTRKCSLPRSLTGLLIGDAARDVSAFGAHPELSLSHCWRQWCWPYQQLRRCSSTRWCSDWFWMMICWRRLCVATDQVLIDLSLVLVTLGHVLMGMCSI